MSPTTERVYKVNQTQASRGERERNARCPLNSVPFLSSLLHQEGDRAPRSPPTLRLPERHAKHVEPHILYVPGGFLQACLHVPELGAIGRIWVWSIQKVGLRGTLGEFVVFCVGGGARIGVERLSLACSLNEERMIVRNFLHRVFRGACV